jgi:hypothetical protein
MARRDWYLQPVSQQTELFRGNGALFHPIEKMPETARGNACRRTSGMGRRAVKSLLDLFAQARRFRRMGAVCQTSGKFGQLGARQHRALAQVLREGDHLGLFAGR